jgi:hypothetical protein
MWGAQLARARKAMDSIQQAEVTEKDIADSWCLISSMPEDDRFRCRDEMKRALESLTRAGPAPPGQGLGERDVQKLEKIAAFLPVLMSIRRSLQAYQKLNMRDVDISSETGLDAT